MTNIKQATVSEETFDDFLAKEGLLGSCKDHALKELIAEQLSASMKEQGISKTAMAGRMRTSRRQLNRLLDPASVSVNLDTLQKAAHAIGRRLRVELG